MAAREGPCHALRGRIMGRGKPKRTAAKRVRKSAPVRKRVPSSRRAVETALASLSDEFRVAVVLCDVEGLSYEEISDVLGIKLGTVRSRIHRGRTQLRAALAHRAPRKGRTRFVGPLGV